MNIKKKLKQLDRYLDKKMENLPEFKSKEDRERYKMKMIRLSRKAGATIKSIDEAGDKYAERLIPTGIRDKIIDYTVDNPKKTIIILTLIMLIAATQLPNIQTYMRGEMEIYLPPDHEATIILNEVREDWSTDIIVIYVKSKDNDNDGHLDNVTSYEILREMSHIEGDDENKYEDDELDRGLDYDKEDHGDVDNILYVLSISTIIKEVNSTPSRFADAIRKNVPVYVPGLVDMPGNYSIPPDQEMIDNIVNSISEEQKKNLVRDTDGDGIYDTAVIILAIKPGTKPSYMVKRVDKAIERLKPEKSVMRNTGPMTVIEKIQGRTIQEFTKTLPFGVLFLIIVLLIFHRNIRAPLIALVPVFYSIVVTYGIIGALHDYLIISPQIALAAVVLLALGIAYGVYIANRYAEERKGTPQDKAKKAAKFMSVAILLSAGTTAIGFSSLMVATLPPIAVLGFALSLGIMLTYVFTMLMVPSLTIWFKYTKRRKIKGWKRLARFPIYNRKKTILMTFILIILSIFLIPSITFNADYLAMAPEDDQAVIDMNEYSRTMGGGQMGMVIVRGDPKDYDVLKVMDKMQSNINRVENTKSMSVVDMMKLIKTPDNVTLPMFGGSYSIPANVTFWQIIESTANPTLQRLMISIFYDVLSPEMRSMLINRNETKTLIFIFQPMMDIEETRKAVNGVNTAVDMSGTIPGGTVSHITGVAAIQLAVNDLLIVGQLQSLAACIIACLIVLLIIFKSWRLAIFTIIPPVVVVALEPMVLVGLSIPLSIVTVMIGSIAIGTGVDFSIQLTQRVRSEGLNMESVMRAVEFSGISFVEVTAAMIAGFMSALIGPGFIIDYFLGNPVHIVAGIPVSSVRDFITMVIILLGLNAIAAIFLLPAIYTVWFRWRELEKKRIEKEGW